jgi:hypothetical protein
MKRKPAACVSLPLPTRGPLTISCQKPDRQGGPVSQVALAYARASDTLFSFAISVSAEGARQFSAQGNALVESVWLSSNSERVRENDKSIEPFANTFGVTN